MPVQMVENRRLYRQIADQIESLIGAGEFAPGDRLPPERDLAAKLGVSRATVREAMIALELGGLVDIRIGSGIYVTATRKAEAAKDDPGPGPFELIDARRAIESGVAALAAMNATSEEIDAVAETVAAMRAAQKELPNSEEADRLFHLNVARATHNALLTRTVKELWEWREGPMWTRLHATLYLADIHERWIADHERVVEALRKRDPAGAAAAMEAHLLGVKEVLLKAISDNG
jgi:DNA-binding FadR family transcriptional regulator